MVLSKGKLIKKPKNTTGGALVGFIPGLISVVMLFVPLSGVFSIAQSVTRVDVKNGVSFGTNIHRIHICMDRRLYFIKKMMWSFEIS